MLVASKGADKGIFMADRAGFRRPEAVSFEGERLARSEWGITGSRGRGLQADSVDESPKCSRLLPGLILCVLREP